MISCARSSDCVFETSRSNAADEAKPTAKRPSLFAPTNSRSPAFEISSHRPTQSTTSAGSAAGVMIKTSAEGSRLKMRKNATTMPGAVPRSSG
jgi:hypothetical protein